MPAAPGGCDWHMVVKDENKDVVLCIRFGALYRLECVKGVASIYSVIRPRSDFDDEVTRHHGRSVL